MSQEQLDELFKQSPPGDIPEGEGDGEDGYENDPHRLGDPTSRVADDLLARKENRCSSVESLQP